MTPSSSSSSSSCCKGGFCELTLSSNNASNNNNASSNKANNNASSSTSITLSKRQQRLQRSKCQRENAIRLLSWILTTEEYTLLEENGDLIRLRIKHHPSSSSSLSSGCQKKKKKQGGDGEKSDTGYWIAKQEITLANKEYRPDLARLAFAEYQSSSTSLSSSCDDLLDNDANFNNTSASVARDVAASSCTNNHAISGPAFITEPPSSHHANDKKNDGDVLVCGTCFNVYTLLRQARDLLASYEHDQTNEVEASTANGENVDDVQEGASNNQLLVEKNNNLAVNNTGDTTTTPTDNLLQRSSTEGQHSSVWNNNNKSVATTAVSSSASFHGPISPSHNNNHKRSGTAAKSNRKAKRKKREQKQKEENSKIHILLAESDEVCLCCVSIFLVCQKCVAIVILPTTTRTSPYNRQLTNWPNDC